MHTPNHFKNNLKTIRATEIVQSARSKCLEVLFQIPSWITAQILFNIDTQGTQHSHDTRQRDQLREDRSGINLADNRIRIFLPTLANSSPLDLLHKITTHSIQGFSSHIKRYLINRYRDNCSSTNCYMCQYQFWCFIVINTLAPFGGALMILNTFIGNKSVNWGAKWWNISRGLQLATTFKVYSDCTINIYMLLIVNLSVLLLFHRNMARETK